MKKILLVAALAASTIMPSAVFAADMAPAASAAPKPICYLLPLTPDCLSAWKAEHDAWVAKWKAAPKVAVAAPAMPHVPTCAKAAAGAGHLYDCKM